MTTTITRPAIIQRLRLVGSEESRSIGTAEAQKLLACAFPAEDGNTPAEALYTAIIEYVALAHDNRFEEMNERLKAFCEVVGPVLYQPHAPAAPVSANDTQLFGELQAAHAIIRNALAVMTTEQKAKWGEMNENANVAGEGITRANERAVAIATASANSKRLSMRESNAAYGEGSAKGCQAADEWLANPHRGDPKRGGTLQHAMLNLAERMRNAQGAEEIERTRGEIVGFCYRIECPADSIACMEIMDKATKKGPTT